MVKRCDHTSGEYDPLSNVLSHELDNGDERRKAQDWAEEAEKHAEAAAQSETAAKACAEAAGESTSAAAASAGSAGTAAGAAVKSASDAAKSASGAQASAESAAASAEEANDAAARAEAFAQKASPDAKQDKLTGTSGQVVGFDDTGNTQAVEIVGENHFPLSALPASSDAVNITRNANGYMIVLTTKYAFPNFFSNDFIENVKPLFGKYCTLSFWAEADQETSLQFDFFNTTQNEYFGKPFDGGPNPIGPGAKKFTVSGVLPRYVAGLQFHLRFWRLDTAPLEEIRISKIKIEAGQIATSWLPAPEDLQSKLSGRPGQVAGFDADGNMQATKIGGTNILRGTNPVTWNKSGNWSDGGWVWLNNGDEPEFFTVTDSPDPNIHSGWRVTNATTGKFSDVSQYSVPVTIGEIYTLSGYVRGSGNFAFFASSVTNDGYIGSRGFSMSDKWERFSVSFKPTQNKINVLFGADGNYEFCGFKLELGNIATDWSPAPEDLQLALFNSSGEVQLTGDNLKNLAAALKPYIL